MRTETEENKLGFLNLLVFVLSVYILLALFIDTIPDGQRVELSEN